jgi:hypothetical protein
MLPLHLLHVPLDLVDAVPYLLHLCSKKEYLLTKGRLLGEDGQDSEKVKLSKNRSRRGGERSRRIQRSCVL